MMGMRLGLVAMAVLAIPGIAQAQVRGGEPMGPNLGGVYPLPQDIRPMGIQQGRYISNVQPAHFEDDDCKRIGCLIVVNKSANAEISQLYINDGEIDSHGVPNWGANQFQGFSLDPNRAVWTPRPRKMKCEVVIRAVLRDPKSGAEHEGIQRVDMCALSKAGFTVVEIQGDGPRVILENGAPGGS